MNFGGSVGHFVNRLVDNDFGVTFPHDFVDLMSFRSDEQRNHSFGNENYNRKLLFFNCFKHLINIMKKTFGAMILLFHLMIKNLYTYHVYLNISAV